MASKFPVCGICDSRNISVPSAAWCFECYTGICEECKEQHLLNEAHRSHGIIPLTDYQKLSVSVLQIAESCKLHCENYQAYCHEHECSYCTKCLIEEHRNCKDLTNIHDGICSINSSKTICEIQSSFQELAENLKRIKKNREENMSSLKLDRQNIDKEIQKARHAINEHFDRLEEELMKELTRVVDYESRKIRNILASLERTEKEIVELQVTLAILKQHESDQLSFQVSKQIQHKLIDTNNFIQSMHDNNELSDVNISLQMDDFVKIVKQNIIKTGEIVVQTSPVYTALMKQEFKEAKYAELSEIVVQTSSVYMSLMRQKNKGAEYSELGESDVQITQAYTSLMIQEDKEEAYTELGEIVEQTSPIYTSSTGQENREEAYTELGEIVEQTDPFNMSIVRQKNKQAQSNVSKSKSAQENEYDTIPTTEHDTDFCFIVMVKPGKDAKKFGLNNKYQLYVKPEGFTLEDTKKGTLKCHWPYDIVRQYGKSKEGREIVITVGRKHILGPGNVTFRCDSRDNLDRLFRLVPIFIKRIHSAVKP